MMIVCVRSNVVAIENFVGIIFIYDNVAYAQAMGSIKARLGEAN